VKRKIKFDETYSARKPSPPATAARDIAGQSPGGPTAVIFVDLVLGRWRRRPPQPSLPAVQRITAARFWRMAMGPVVMVQAGLIWAQMGSDGTCPDLSPLHCPCSNIVSGSS
jgi:hypothetical protein